MRKTFVFKGWHCEFLLGFGYFHHWYAAFWINNYHKDYTHMIRLPFFYAYKIYNY